MGDGLTVVIDDRAGSVYYFAKAVAGGHTSVETGICLGMGISAKKSC